MKLAQLLLIAKAQLITKNDILAKETKGFSLVEILLAVSVFSLITVGVVGAYLYGEESSVLAGNHGRAILLAQEGLEATRNIYDQNFTNLVNGTFGLATSSNTWVFSGSQDVNDIFTRSINISTVDADRKNIISTVSWQQNAQRTGTVVLNSLFSNWRKIVSTIGNWANPNTQTGSYNATASDDGLKVKIQGSYAYLVRGTGSPNFLVINISSTTAPVLTGSLTLAGNPAKIFVAGNFAYVTNGDNNQELQIINISTPSAPVVDSAFNATGNANGLGIYVSGTTAYLGRDTTGGNSFVIVNVTTSTAPTLIGSLNLGQAINDVTVSGNYAYLASSHTTQELKVVNITNPALPTLIGGINFTGTLAALAIEPSGTNLLVGNGTSLRIVNASSSTNPILTSSFTTANTINDIAIGNSGNYAYLAEVSGTAELQVVNITTPASPVLVGDLNSTGNFNGIDYDSVSDRAFCATALDASELMVIAP